MTAPDEPDTRPRCPRPKCRSVQIETTNSYERDRTRCTYLCRSCGTYFGQSPDNGGTK